MSLLLALLLAGQTRMPVIQFRQRSSCRLASAERVTFEQVHRDPERLGGRCIALRGIWSGRALYRREAASRARDAEYDEATENDRVGLYGSHALERDADRHGAYDAVGLLMDCEVLWEGTDFVPGYCHNNRSGPILIVTELRRRHWPTLRGPW